MSLFTKLSPIRVIHLGKGYASSTVNMTLGRHHGLVTQGDYQFGAFYDSDAQIAVVRRDLHDDTLEVGTVSGSFSPEDVHNYISLGLDSAGFVHIAYDHHCNPLNYRRSMRPNEVTAWTNPLPMTGRLEDRITYPFFVMCPHGAFDSNAGGKLLFLYRHEKWSNGDMCLKAYCPASQAWSDLAERFVKGTDQTPWTSNAYWNHPAFDSQGNMVLTWIWRVAQKASAKGDFIFNHNHGFARSRDGRHWFTSRGIELSLPITQVNSEVIWATTPGATIGNMSSSAVDSLDRPHVVTFGADAPNGVPQYQHLWFDGQKWRLDILSARDTSFGLVTWDIPMSMPEILIDGRDTAYVIYRCDTTENKLVAQRLDPPDYEPPGTIFELWSEDLGHSDPIIDRLRWLRDGVLSMLIQRSIQPASIARECLPPEPVRIAEWQF